MIQQAMADELVTLNLFVGLKWPRWRTSRACLNEHQDGRVPTEGSRAAERLAAIVPPAFAFTSAGPPPWQFMDRAEKRP